MNIDALGVAFDTISAFEAEDDFHRVAHILKSYMDRYGLLHLLVTGLPENQNSRWHRSIILDGWPVEWFERYTAEGHFPNDPCVSHTRTASGPFRWSDLSGRELTADQSRVMSEATEFALNDGVCIPIHRPHHPPSVVSAAGSAVRLEALDLSMIEMVCIYAFRSLDAAMPASEAESVARISPREREVLSWIAAGKSAEDVACILGITRYTVERHLSNVRERLGAINTIHAVTQAIRRGDIHP